MACLKGRHLKLKYILGKNAHFHSQKILIYVGIFFNVIFFYLLNNYFFEIQIDVLPDLIQKNIQEVI